MWMEMNGPEGDVIISSRVRLARNFYDIPFPTMMNEKDAQEVARRVREAVMKRKRPKGQAYHFLSLMDLPTVEQQVLVEKHLASPDLLQFPDKGALLVRDDETISIMINEEDHLRIQCLLPGLQLEEACQRAIEIDDSIEEDYEFSYDEQLGYLTCCPTNVGTGMRASVMMHLPALTMTGYIGSVLQAVSKIGLAVRGIYGEGTEVLGNMYTISNQITLGQTEEDIIRNLIDISRQIIGKERAARNTILTNKAIELEDRLFRSYGIFVNARRMDSKEFMKLLSDVRLAIDLGLITHIDRPTINRLMIQGQPATLQKMEGRELSPEERDVIRANLVRRTMQGMA